MGNALHTVLAMAAKVCKYEVSGNMTCMMTCARFASLLHAALRAADAKMKKLLSPKMEVK